MQWLQRFVVKHPVIYWIVAILAAIKAATLFNGWPGGLLFLGVVVVAGVLRQLAAEAQPEAYAELQKTREEHKALRAKLAKEFEDVKAAERAKANQPVIVHHPEWESGDPRTTLYVMKKNQRAIRSFVASLYAPGKPPRGDIVLKGYAELVPEPTNSYDHEAVLAVANGVPLGYFSTGDKDAANELLQINGDKRLVTPVLIATNSGSSRAWVFPTSRDFTRFSSWLERRIGSDVHQIGMAANATGEHKALRDELDGLGEESQESGEQE